jgi:hypothetical protein
MECGKRMWVLVSVVAALAVVGTATAAVTFHSDGTGFVGKGDVQNAFGWNNAQFKANAPGITFTEANDLEELQTCTQLQNFEIVGEWVRHRSFDEDLVDTHETRRHNHKITGFALTGPDFSTFSLHFDPWLGDTLPPDCFDSTGSLVGSTIDDNGNGWLTDDRVDPDNTISLYVNYGGERVRLARTPG